MLEITCHSIHTLIKETIVKKNKYGPSLDKLKPVVHGVTRDKVFTISMEDTAKRIKQATIKRINKLFGLGLGFFSDKMYKAFDLSDSTNMAAFEKECKRWLHFLYDE